MTQPPRLLDQFKEVARLKHFSLKTEKSYLYSIWDFILFHDKRHLQDMGAPEILAYRVIAVAPNQNSSAATSFSGRPHQSR